MKMQDFVMSVLSGTLSRMNERLPDVHKLRKITLNKVELTVEEMFVHSCQDPMMTAGSILAQMTYIKKSTVLEPSDTLKLANNFHDQYRDFFITSWERKEQIFEEQKSVSSALEEYQFLICYKCVHGKYPNIQKCAESFMKYIDS